MEVDRLEVAIESQASAAIKELNKLEDALGRVAGKLTGIKVPGGLGINSGATGSTTRQTAKLSNAFGKLKSSMSGIIGTSTAVTSRTKESGKAFVGVTGNIAKLTVAYKVLEKSLGSFIGKSMDYTETLNYFDVAFEDVGSRAASQWKEFGYDSAEAYVNSFAERAKQLTSKMTGMSINDNGTLTPTGQKSLGMDPEQLMNYQAGFAQMSSSIGVTSEMSLKLSNALTMLGADLASVKNISFDSAWNNLQSGMAGMSRAVDKFGINIRNVNLEQKAAELGYYKSAVAMNQNEKEMLRVIIMLESTKYAWGDMAETLNAPANQLRLLQQNFANLARMIGNIFLPVVAKVLPYINGLVIALQRLFSWIGSLLGVDFSSFGNIGGSSSGLSDLLDSADTSDAMGDIAAGADDTASGLDKANEAAKKLKRTILGFDELNVLNDDDSSSNSAYSPSVGSSGGIGDFGNYDMGILEDALSKAIDEYQKAWDEAFSRMKNKANDFADEVEKAFKKIWKTAKPTRDAIWNLWNGGFKQLSRFSFDTLKDFWNNFLKPIGNWMIGDNSGLPRFFNITNSLLLNINWGKLKSSLADFYTSLQKLTKFSWTALMDFYESFLKPVAVWTMNEAIPQLVDALTAFNNKIHWDELNAALKNFWDALAPFATNVGQGLVNFFKKLLDIGGDFINNVVPGGLDSIADAIKNISPETARNIGEGLGKLAVAIGGLKIVQSVTGLIGKDSVFNKGLTFLGKHKYLTMVGGILGIVGALDQFGVIDVDWEWLWSKIGQIKDILAEFIDKIDFEALSDMLRNLWESFQPFAKGFAEGFINAFDVILNDIGAPLINALAKALGALAEVLSNIPPEVWEAVGKALGTIVAVKLTKDFVWKTMKLGSAFDALKKALGNDKGGSLAEAIKETGDALGGLGQSTEETGRKTSTTSTLLSGLKSILMGNGPIAAEAGLAVMLGHVNETMETTKNLKDDTVQSYGTVTQALKDLADQGIITNDQLLDMLPSFDTVKTGAFNFDEQFQKVISSLENAGISSDTFKTALRNAMENSSVASNEYSQKISDYLGVAESSIGDLSSKAQTDFPAIDKAVSDASGNIETTTGTTWSNSAGFTSEALTSMQLDVSKGMLQTWKSVQIYMDAICKSIKEGFGAAGKEFSEITSGMKIDTKAKLPEIADEFSGLGDRIQNALGNMYDIGRNAAQSFANGISSVHIPMPHISVSSSTQQSGSGYSYSMSSSVNWYANGGFPNAGELFIANERGPEMIGKMGHRNVVANNKQITEGIKAAVAEGMMEVAMATSSGQQDSVPYVLHAVLKTENDEVLARTVERGKMKRNERYNFSLA